MTNYLSINIEGLNCQPDVVSVTGCEKISHDYEFSLIVRTPIDQPLSAATCLNQALTLIHEGTHSANTQVGVITCVQHVFTSNPNYFQFKLECHSTLQSLKSAIRSNVFIDSSPLDVINEILSGYSHIDFYVSCFDSLPKKAFMHQYKETDYDFLCRLCEHWGIYYYFDPEQSNKLIFADDKHYPDSNQSLRFLENPTPDQRHETITSLTMKENSAINHIIIEGRNPEQDSQIISAEYGEPSLTSPSLKLSGIGIDNEDEAMLISQRRFEQQQCQRKIYFGSSTAQGIKPGFIISVRLFENQPSIQLMVLTVDYQAQNQNSSAHGQLDEFTAHFSAIPADTIFRPELSTSIPTAISSTARVYSSYDNVSLAHRDALGRYKIIFDYMQNLKVSHWIRKSQVAAKDNHLDVPLLPGTEVQIAYLAGNPDLPYISCALENSLSTQIPSNHEHPYKTSLNTTGLLNLEAGRSLSMAIRAPMNKANASNPDTGPDTVTTPSITATVSEYNELDNLGIVLDTDEKLSLDSTRYHLSSTEGQYYKVQDTISFYLGNNPNFYFGQQYKEVHAKHPNEKSVQANHNFSFDLNHILKEDEKNIVKDNANPKSTPAMDKQVGMVRKLFGNRYNYHDGNIVSVRKGENNEPHKTFNYGARYVEHMVSDGDNSTNSMTDGFPLNWQPKETDYIIRNHHKQFKINHNDTITVQKGNAYVEREGNTERIQKGGSSKVMITGTTRSKDINISGESIKEITASTIKSTLNASTISKTVNGNKNSTTSGSDTSSVEGDKHSIICGNKTSVVMGGKAAAELGSSSKFIGGLKTEMVAGLTIKCALLPEIDVSPLKFSKKAYNFSDGDAMVEKAKAKIIKTTLVTITCGAVLMLG